MGQSKENKNMILYENFNQLVEKIGPNYYVQAIGSVATLYLIYRLISIILWNAVYFGPITFDFKKHAAGGYAMITGGAGGIGKATAEQMAIRGIDLILIDFNGKLLEKTVTEFQKKYPDIKNLKTNSEISKLEFYSTMLVSQSTIC